MRILIILRFILLFSFLSNFSFAQNVGIGTTTPLEKLDVQGNIKGDTIKPSALLLTPDAGAGKILTSDNVGNASWQPMMMPPENDESGNVGYGVWGDCATNGNISDYQPATDTVGAIYNYFGHSISVSGQFAMVGSYRDDEGLYHQGSVSVFHHNGVNWEFFQKITDPNAASGDWFGFSVVISGDHAMIGSPNDDDSFTDQGSVCIFQYNGTSWVYVEKLLQEFPGQNYRFGNSAAISGEYAIIGAHLDNQFKGSANMYQFNGSNWILMEQIFDATGSAFDYFGFSVGISGTRAIVGAYLDDAGSAVDQGSASIFEFNGINWTLMQKVTTGVASDFNGITVAIQGDLAAVGAPGTDLNFVEQGSVHMYQFNGSSWVLSTSLKDPSGNPDQEFGHRVCMSGQYLIIGSPKDNGPGGLIKTGSAYIYRRMGLGWLQYQVVYDPGNTISGFGESVSIDSATGNFLIGHPTYANSSGKVVFGKIN